MQKVAHVEDITNIPTEWVLPLIKLHTTNMDHKEKLPYSVDIPTGEEKKNGVTRDLVTNKYTKLRIWELMKQNGIQITNAQCRRFALCKFE